MPTPEDDAADPRRPKRRVALGPTGERVRQNVQEFRKFRRLTHADIVQRLKALGYSMPRTGLSELENGGRRVTVDDLMALAVALDVTPNDLLLPWDDSQGPEEVTALGLVNPKDVWRWADGIDGPPNNPLGGDNGPAEVARPHNVHRAARSEGQNEPPSMEELIRMLKHTGQRVDIIHQWIKERNDAAEIEENRPTHGHD